MDPARLIELFLQKNVLPATLKAFRHDLKRVQLRSAPQLAPLPKTQLAPTQEAQNALREHLQKAEAKPLRRFVERARRSGRAVEEGSALMELPFFQRLVAQEEQRYLAHRQEQLSGRKNPLEESRCLENEWDGDNDQGFDAIECAPAELPRALKEIQASKNYEATTIREAAYPETFFAQWEALRNGRMRNKHDQLPTRLPPDAIFEERDEVYPLEEGGVVFASHELKVVFDREKTGFEEEREMPIVINEVVAGRWQIVGMLGQAQFSKALEVKDLAAGGGKQRYCLKVIHNNKEYMDQALDEVKLHRYLRANCDLEASCLLRMHDYFYHREHLMILTELLRDNLYEAARARPHYFTLPRVQAVARQLLAALATLHRLHVIHSDLKPENVLVKSYSHVQVRLIDFGSSVFFHGPLEPYVQTRSYRAPEVILGLDYTDRIDVWSLGCLLAELLTGQVLFEGDSAVSVLAKVQGMRGPWPSWMLQRGKHVEQYFRKELVLFEELTEEAGQDEDGRPRKRKTGLVRLFRPKTTNLKARLRSNHPAFLDFISKCLKIDPSQRPSARELQLHPFITEPIPE